MIISRISTLKRASLKQASLGLAAILGLGVLAMGIAQGDAIAAEQAACTAEEGAQIEVKVENVRNSKGLITAVLYGDDPEGFLKRGQRLDRIRVEANEGETLLCLKAPAEGRYSIALYHDENGNKEFDRNFLGIPSEGYGFSNNPGFRFGKPEQEETLFSVNGSTTKVSISVLYL
ncbi:DUF2141 domain-containing protein [Pelagibius sp.]|uniref:DUF2141 domain-containing protein n=1 Tax=Pelagibius sp. TaxID=1931238 RepID=UPI0026329CB6|nr:DUF2141 domain-containing protein [Pelagibius sp.]